MKVKHIYTDTYDHKRNQDVVEGMPSFSFFVVCWFARAVSEKSGHVENA